MKTTKMLLKSEIQELARLLAIELGYVEEKLLTIDDVANMLGKTPEAIKKMCQRNRLPFHKHFGTLYFSSTEVKKYLLSKEDIR